MVPPFLSLRYDSTDRCWQSRKFSRCERESEHLTRNLHIRLRLVDAAVVIAVHVGVSDQADVEPDNVADSQCLQRRFRVLDRPCLNLVPQLTTLVLMSTVPSSANSIDLAPQVEKALIAYDNEVVGP